MLELTRRVVLLVAFLVLTGAAGVAVAQNKPAQNKLTLAKRGWINDPKLREIAPPSQVIVSEKKLAALYKAWGLGNEVPKVDFVKELVVVATDDSEGNLLAVVDKGDLKIHFGGPPKGQAGFGYVIQTVSREGVKTVEGKPLPKE